MEPRDDDQPSVTLSGAGGTEVVGVLHPDGTFESANGEDIPPHVLAAAADLAARGPYGGINPLRADAQLPPRLADARERIGARINGVDAAAHEGAHVDYEHPERGAIPPAAGGFLRLSVGDENGAVYVDVPRAEIEDMPAARLGLEVFEMLKELDARNAARDEER